MASIVPNSDWYFSLSSQKNLSPRCPYANVENCSRYYESLSILSNAGFTTSIHSSEEKRLLKKWRKSKLWPKINEHAVSRLDRSNFSHLCPEISYDIFGLFAIELHRYADEIDIHTAHDQLIKEKALDDDPYWNWSQIKPLHYSECSQYSQLLSIDNYKTKANETKEIIEVKTPSILGISLDLKEIVKRVWKCIFSKDKKKDNY